MGIQINGNNDIISALDGSWTAEGASINTSGILTATTFKGNVTGTACTFVDGNFTGNVTIGGTLTYEDVTNIDSVGIITARDGLKVLAGGANVVGVITATGANITGQTTIAHTGSPQLILKDSDSNSPSDANGISLRSANNTEYGFIGQSDTGSHTLWIKTVATTNPIRLQVNSTTRLEVGNSGCFVTGVLDVASGGTSSLRGDVYIPDKLRHIGDDDTSIRFPANDTVTVETANVERFRIGSNGYIGVGDFSSKSRTDPLNVDSGIGTCNIGGNYIHLKRYSGGNTQYITAPQNNANLHISADDFIAFGVDHSSSMYSMGTEAIRITSAGQILFNTNTAFTSVAYRKFQIGQADGGWINLARTGTPANGNHLGAIQAFTRSADGNYHDTTAIDFKADGTISNSSKPSRIEFYTTAGSSTSKSIRMTIKSGGQVRIDGSTSANHGLRFTPGGWNGYDNRMGYCGSSGADFWWSSNWNPTDGARDHSGYATNFIRQNISNGYLSFGTGAVNASASERLRITSAGNVGINPDSNGPDQLLHVSDTSNAAAVNLFRLTNTGGSPSTEVRMEFECGVDEIATISAKNEGSDTGPLIFSTASSQNAYPSEKVRIDKDGRLRVASTTESADAAFDDLIVGNHSGNRGISILSTNGQQGALGFAKSGTLADGYVAYVHNSTATSSVMTIKSSGLIKFSAGGQERLRMTGNELRFIGGDQNSNEGSKTTKIVYRSLTATVWNTVEIGNISGSNGACSFRMTINCPNSGWSITKIYDIASAYNFTTNNWRVVKPITSTYQYDGDDFEVNIKINTSTTYLRLRKNRSSSSRSGTLQVIMEIYGKGEVFSGTSATGSDSGQLEQYEGTPIGAYSDTSANVGAQMDYNGVQRVKTYNYGALISDDIGSTIPNEFPADNRQLMVYTSTNGQAIGNTACARVLIATDAKQTGAQGYHGSIDFGSSDCSASGGAAEFNWRTAAIMCRGDGDTSPSIADGDLQFWTKTASGTMTHRFDIAPNGDLTATDTNGIGSLSDQRLKTNIQDYTYDLNKFKQLKTRTFDWINPEFHQEGNIRGFIAQEIETVDPYWNYQFEVSKETAKKDYDLLDNGDENYTIRDHRPGKASKLGGKDTMYVSVIQQLMAKIETLEAKVAALES